MTDATRSWRCGKRGAVLVLFVLFASAGCGIVMIGEPVEEMDLSNQDSSKKNLEAVRAMQSQSPPPGGQVPRESKPTAAP